MCGSHAAGGPDGGRRHGPVGPADGGEAAGRPTGQAGLPPGTPSIHPRLCPARQVGMAFGLGRPRAARCGDRRTCHKRLSRAPPLLALTLYKSGFRGSFSLAARKSVLEGQANCRCRGSVKISSGHLLVIRDVICGAGTCHLRRGGCASACRVPTRHRPAGRLASQRCSLVQARDYLCCRTPLEQDAGAADTVP